MKTKTIEDSLENKEKLDDEESSTFKVSEQVEQSLDPQPSITF